MLKLFKQYKCICSLYWRSWQFQSATGVIFWLTR